MSDTVYGGPRRASSRKTGREQRRAGGGGRGGGPRRTGPARPHAAVAERFRWFLESAGLTREAFVEAVDGAVTARTLFSVLSGARQPSRALAVLIERTWGFRAAFLLEGRGAMWTAPAAASGPEPHPGLAPQEQELVDFARGSVEGARALGRALEQARLWQRLFARTSRLLAELEECGRSQDPADRLLYPLFAKLVYEECHLIAARFEELESLHHKRRVHALTTAFTERYVRDVPRTRLGPEAVRELDAMLEPVMQRRRARSHALDAAAASLRATLENICELGSPKPLLEEHAAHGRMREQREALARLEQGLEPLLSAGDAPPAVRRRAGRALAALRASLDETPRFWPLFKQLVEGLLLEVEPEVLEARPQSVEQIEALYRRILEPLRG